MTVRPCSWAKDTAACPSCHRFGADHRSPKLLCVGDEAGRFESLMEASPPEISETFSDGRLGWADSKDRVHRRKIDRLDQVMVEAGLPRLLAV